MNKTRSVFFRNIILMTAVSSIVITGIMNLITPTTRKIDDWLYPLMYEETVKKYAKTYKVEAALAQAVIREESRFSERALSGSGAIGLMATGFWLFQLTTPVEAQFGIGLMSMAGIRTLTMLRLYLILKRAIMSSVF